VPEKEAVSVVSNRRKLRQGNGGKLTRDRAKWTHKTRLSSGSSAFRPAASRNRAAERDRLHGVSARNWSNGVQAAQGGLSVRCDLDLLKSLKQGRDDSQAASRV
jgi:hypothetical protein